MPECLYEKNVNFDSSYRIQKNLVTSQVVCTFKKKTSDFPEERSPVLPLLQESPLNLIFPRPQESPLEFLILPLPQESLLEEAPKKRGRRGRERK
ncbi:hypothetical protein RCL_jg6909.t1 [Rhizophagus clarus]|uniref:Uncharacterized protein n=1 Tax=Rhizophagus clarus TaxID=94130 RepID=A0A8H3L9Q8_9GLOM|nr:hypothetical protein RCL_jg6909.t1 [Rhizophagus clarus]